MFGRRQILVKGVSTGVSTSSLFVYKKGTAPHLNTFELGQYGRSRSNVWSYAGVNSFRAGRMDELRMHPTVKPVAMIADAMKDCSHRGAIVLDSFCGSGSTIAAAEQVGRRAYCIEIDARYVDVSIQRWQRMTEQDALLEATGQIFEELRIARIAHEKLASVASGERMKGARRAPAYRLLKGEKRAVALADGIRSAYAPLFDADQHAHKLAGDKLKSLVAQVAGTDADLTSRITGTFSALAKLGGFDASMNDTMEESRKDVAENDPVHREQLSERLPGKGLRTEFHYNIQVQLPSNGSEETYLNIFNAIRKTFQ